MFEKQFQRFISEIAAHFAERTGQDIETATKKVCEWANQNQDAFTASFVEWNA